MDKRKAFEYINKHSMIQKGDIVVVALSGGADSMALFHFLLNSASELGITVRAAHVNHKMRKESDTEAQGVQALCTSNNIKLYFTELSPPDNPSEEWARDERYRFFEEIISSDSTIKIATAHTASDNAETVLFRLCRGTSVRGAGGIPPTRGNLIRPILCFDRAAIELYCEANNISYYTDETNFTTQYTRGLIRNQMLTKLCEVHPAAKESLARFAENARETQSYIDQQALLLLNNAKLGQSYSAVLLKNEHSALAKAAIYHLIADYGSIDEKTVNSCYNLLFTKSGSVNLPNGNALRLQANKIGVDTQKIKNSFIQERPFDVGKHVFSNSKTLYCEIRECEETFNYLKYERKGLIFCADYGKIPKDTCFRSRQVGDTYAPKSRNVTKSLKKYMNEKGILRSERNELVLLASQNRILWIWGVGFCEELSPDKSTKKLLTIKICEVEEK